MSREEFLQKLRALFVEYEEKNRNSIVVGANVCIQFTDDSVGKYHFDGEMMVEGLDCSSVLTHSGGE